MIRSVRKRKKRQKDLLGMIGISFLLICGGGFTYYSLTKDSLDEFMCWEKKGPNAVTAIIFDKSVKYSAEQVTDIENSFKFWLKAQEPPTKNRPIDLKFFNEGNLIQVYVADEEKLTKPEGLQPLKELCAPKDFQEANELIENPDFLEDEYNEFMQTFNDLIESLLEKSEGMSPIMETIVRISNSESFLKHGEAPHYLFIVSDMIQHTENWSHYPDKNQGVNWEKFEKQMKGTVYMGPRLNQVEVQIFYADGESKREKDIQNKELMQFWGNFFKNGKAKLTYWIEMDG